MSVNSPATQPLENLTAYLPALQNNLKEFLAEYEDKVVQTRAQIAHIEALLESLPIEAPHDQGKAKNRGTSHSTTPNLQKTKRHSLFGSDKDKIIIGEKFDEPLTEFQDFAS